MDHVRVERPPPARLCRSQCAERRLHQRDRSRQNDWAQMISDCPQLHRRAAPGSRAFQDRNDPARRERRDALPRPGIRCGVPHRKSLNSSGRRSRRRRQRREPGLQGHRPPAARRDRPMRLEFPDQSALTANTAAAKAQAGRAGVGGGRITGAFAFEDISTFRR